MGTVSGLKMLSTSAAIKDQEVIQLHFTSETGESHKISRLRSAGSTPLTGTLASTTTVDFEFEQSIHFETIAAASNMNVEMYSVSSGGFFGKQRRFLGELDVPLLPTADKSSSDTLAFSFSRRYQSRINREDIVDGTIELSFNWTINLQDLMILKARILESELRARKEILSLLRDTRIVSSRAQQQDQIAAQLARAGQDSEPAMFPLDAATGDVVDEQKRRQQKSIVSVDKFKGMLEIKVYTAKKLPQYSSHIRETLSKLLSADYNRGSSTSLYVLMKVQSTSSNFERKTRYVDRVRRSEAEFGDSTFKINEVPGDARLIFELYEVRGASLPLPPGASALIDLCARGD